ncbi:MAG TPA: hypothetical protein P5279_14080 [Anaerohalosphaeraceae bacterium]|jgi:hypothetical protein|nr:hypothetical protein [Anaerohalosphaeraceae bacterium]
MPEQVVFDPANHTRSGLIEVEDAGPQVTTSMTTVSMNYRNVHPRRVFIRRQVIEIQQDHTNAYYEMFDGAYDIETMEMVAEKVIIRSPLHLHQTNVIIRANELIMEGPDAAIITTPMKNTMIPPGSTGPGDPGDDGIAGLRAGNITLEVGQLTMMHPGTRFDLRGGPGQDGGDGRSGKNGESMAGWLTFGFTDSWWSYAWTAPAGEFIIYEEAWATGIFFAYDYPVGGIGSKRPTSGENASPSGKPGKGGIGGTLKTTQPLGGDYIDLRPGERARHLHSEEVPVSIWAGQRASRASGW